MIRFFLIIQFLCAISLVAETYHIDSVAGNDDNRGTAKESPWATLENIRTGKFKAGDEVLLRRGSTFRGSIVLKNLKGTRQDPFVIGAYGDGPAPVINADAHVAGVHLQDCEFVFVKDLEIHADAGNRADSPKFSRAHGVWIQATEGGSFANITLSNLYIHDIFPSQPRSHEGIRSTTYLGNGVTVDGNGSDCRNVLVKNCRIETTGFKAVEMKRAINLQVIDNVMRNIGGPAIQPGRVNHLIVRGNTVEGSGSSSDPRMHGRGSGIWPWTCNDVLIERNRFMHARGPGDSCGVHIDFNCRDVIVQYNFSYDNEGGFIEVLGNNYNCTYRYNISVNDGFREKGKNGAFQEGKILWTSGYVGRDQEKHGPYHTYIYNNTVYVKEGGRTCFSLSHTTRGLLVANNIFHLPETILDVLGDQDSQDSRSRGKIPNSLVQNNLFLRMDALPESLPVNFDNSFEGDVGFARAGGVQPEDYIPRNSALVKDKGIAIPLLPGDDLGLKPGLTVSHDFLGNPVKGMPDLGAIETSGNHSN